MANNFQNTAIGAADVYIDGRHVGLMQGPIVGNYMPTLLPLKVGTPLQEEGAYIVEEESSLEFPVLEFSADNIADIIGRALVPVSATGTTEETDESITLSNDSATLAHTPDDPEAVVLTADPAGSPYVYGDDYTITGAVVSRVISGAIGSPDAALLADYSWSAPPVGDRTDFGGVATLEEVMVQAIYTNPRFGWKETLIIPRARTEGNLSLTWDSTSNKYRTTDAKFVGLRSADPQWADCPLGCHYRERLANTGTVSILKPGDPPPASPTSAS